jgi:hypothetical protein
VSADDEPECSRREIQRGDTDASRDVGILLELREGGPRVEDESSYRLILERDVLGRGDRRADQHDCRHCE